MIRWIAVLRALPLTFAVYVIEALAGLVVGLPSALELSRAGSFGFDDAGRAAWLEQALAWDAAGRVAGTTALLVGALLVLLSPWLHMAWLAALSSPHGPGAALARGARLWLRACGVSCWVFVGSLLAALPFGLLAWGVSRLLADHPNVRVRDLALVVSLAPCLPLAWGAFTWHDLARARALQEGMLRSAVRSLRSVVRPSVQFAACAWAGLGLTLVAGAYALVGRSGSSWWTGELMGVALIQAALFGRLVLRSRWLATALACAEPEDGSRARHFAREM